MIICRLAPVNFLLLLQLASPGHDAALKMRQILISSLGENFRCLLASHTAAAIQVDAAVGRDFAYALLQSGQRNIDGARNIPLLNLAWLTHVDQHMISVRIELILQLVGIDVTKSLYALETGSKEPYDAGADRDVDNKVRIHELTSLY